MGNLVGLACDNNRVRYYAGATAGKIDDGTIHDPQRDQHQDGELDQLRVAADPVRAQPEEDHPDPQP